MGLLDSVVGMLSEDTSAASGGQGPLVQAALAAMSGEGGLSALVAKFQQAGLGDVVGSWVGAGQNLPVSAEQLQQVLGSDTLSGLAARFGLPADDVGGRLAQWLPQVVDGLTPDGQLPASGGMGDIGALLGRLAPR